MATTVETTSNVSSEELRELYDSDFAMWTEETGKHLQNRNQKFRKLKGFAKNL